MHYLKTVAPYNKDFCSQYKKISSRLTFEAVKQMLKDVLSWYGTNRFCTFRPMIESDHAREKENNRIDRLEKMNYDF